MTREERLRQYRHFRAINKRQQSEAMDCVSHTTVLDCARRLGLARGRMLLLDNPDEINLVFDLVVHAGISGRSRAIDRYADKNPPLPGSDDAFMLAAARKAKFCIWTVERRHDIIGLHVVDITHDKQEFWLIDESLEASCPIGSVFAGRLIDVGEYVMTCGAVAPIDEFVMAEALILSKSWLTSKEPDASQDPRFAMAIFRGVLRSGLLDGVRFIDPTAQNVPELVAAG
jgi:hypothetical protein